MEQKFKIILAFLLIAVPVFVIGQDALPNQGDHTVCQFSSQPYGVEKVGNSTYEWTIIPITGGNGIIQDSKSNPISIYWENSGTCTLQLIETNELGCSVTVSIKITVNPTPVLSINNPGASCNTVDLTAPAVVAGSVLPEGTVLSYWSNEVATTELINPQQVSSSGIYYIKALSSGGCFDIMPVTVTINPSIVPLITGVDITCSGETGKYGVPYNSPNTYSWIVTGGSILSGQNTNEISVKWGSENGIVSVTETSNSCTSSASKEVTINPLPATLTIFHN